MRIRGARRVKSVIRRLRGRGDGSFLQNLDGGFAGASCRALLYHKTEPFLHHDSLRDYSHTNLWEITEIVRLLNTLGFVVDVIDRSRKDFVPEDKYDLFIGLGSGNSGKYFAKYAAAMPRAVKVLLATGPMPTTSDALVRRQYDEFNARHGSVIPAMRTYETLEFDTFVRHVDYFLVIGEPDQFCSATYAPLGKPILNFLPGTAPNVRFDYRWLDTRLPTSFLCFAGNGLICKGVDLVVEAFLEMPELQLHFCGPDTEPGFFDVLGKAIDASPNIRYEGFVPVGGARFSELLATSSFVIHAASSEGCTTSVATVMRGGLVPILTRETGVKTEPFGIALSGPRGALIEEIRTVARRASAMPREEYRERVYGTLADAVKYTQASFSQTFAQAILQVMHERLPG